MPTPQKTTQEKVDYLLRTNPKKACDTLIEMGYDIKFMNYRTFLNYYNKQKAKKSPEAAIIEAVANGKKPDSKYKNKAVANKDVRDNCKQARKDAEQKIDKTKKSLEVSQKEIDTAIKQLIDRYPSACHSTLKSKDPKFNVGVDCKALYAYYQKKASKEQKQALVELAVKKGYLKASTAQQMKNDAKAAQNNVTKTNTGNNNNSTNSNEVTPLNNGKPGTYAQMERAAFEDFKKDNNEGYYTKAYLDPNGHPTIGVGHLIFKKEEAQSGTNKQKRLNEWLACFPVNEKLKRTTEFNSMWNAVAHGKPISQLGVTVTDQQIRTMFSKDFENKYNRTKYGVTDVKPPIKPACPKIDTIPMDAQLAVIHCVFASAGNRLAALSDKQKEYPEILDHVARIRKGCAKGEDDRIQCARKHAPKRKTSTPAPKKGKSR